MMIPIPLSALLLLPLASGDPEQSSDNVVRVYDVSTLSLDYDLGDEGSAHYLPLLPYMEPVDEADDDVDATPDRGGAEAFVNMLFDQYAAEFEYEGRQLYLNSSDKLLVKGPADLQERVAGMLRFFETVQSSGATIAFDVVELPYGVELPEASVLELAEAEALLSNVLRHEAYTLRVRPGRAARLDARTSRRAVVDLDVEIASGVAVGDPIVVEVPSGTRLELRASGAEGGLFLALNCKRGEWLAAPDRMLDLGFWAGVEKGGLEVKRDSSILQRARSCSRSMGFSTFLPDGKVLAISAGLALPEGRREVFLLRRTGGALPVRRELPLSSGGPSVILADLGAVAPPCSRAAGILFSDSMPLALGSAHPTGFHTTLQVFMSPESGEEVFELLSGADVYSSLNHLGPFLALCPQAEYLREYAPEIKSEQQALIGAFEALMTEGELLDVKVVVRDNETEMATSRLPMRAGTEAALVLGIEDTDLADFDVEVAQSAAVADPTIRSTFEGLALWLAVTPSLSGELVLELRGGAGVERIREEIDLGSPLYNGLECTGVETLLLSERVHLVAENGVWSARFGSWSGLEVEVTIERP